MAMTFKAAAPLDAEAALPWALLMQHLKEPQEEELVVKAARAGALSWIEKRAGVSLTRRLWRATFSGLVRTDTALHLPMGPVAVVGVTYTDAAAATRSWPEASWAFNDGCLRTTSGLSWFGAFADMPVTIEYQAGYQDLASDEPALQTAALLLAGHFFSNREQNVAITLASIPFGVETLIDIDRMPVLR